MPKESPNVGDLRIEIDYDMVEAVTNKAFVAEIKKCVSAQRPCTFFKIEKPDASDYVSVYLAVGHFMEKHMKTRHATVHYFQFRKRDGTFLSNQFSTVFLEEFAPIGITVSD